MRLELNDIQVANLTYALTMALTDPSLEAPHGTLKESLTETLATIRSQVGRVQTGPTLPTMGSADRSKLTD
jgi:hypothetical protein